MKREDVSVGMKVIPQQKTAGFVTLEKSVEWQRAIRNGQSFLYVSGWREEEQAFCLCEEKPVEGNPPEGDFFHAEDFTSYEEPIPV